MKMSFPYRLILMQMKVIFIRMVSLLDSFSNRGTRELANGLFHENEAQPKQINEIERHG